jgi:M6 family metalloprotease-like protein
VKGKLRRLTVLIGMLAGAAMAIVPVGSASAISGTHPLAVVLCKFTDRTSEPHPVSYYQDMFSETGAGKRGVFDYWKEVSYNQLDLTGTVVKGWYTVPKTVAQWNALSRPERLDTCASQAVNDIDYNNFAGVVVLTNQTGLQEDLFGKGPPTTISGTTYNSLGQMLSEEDQQFNGILHESGHALRVNHSRTLSQQPSQDDYGDVYDVMSCLGCRGTYSPWGVRNLGGPGLNVVQLDTAGWIPAARNVTVDNSSCQQRTVQMAALNHPEAAGYLEAQIPAAIQIKKIGTSTTTDHYAFELRETNGWDAGILGDTILVHLHGQDGYSYWVDQSGLAGTYISSSGGTVLRAGDEYVDSANKAYLAVNRMDSSAHTATVTLAGCKIDATLNYSGDTSADFNDQVTLAGDLTVSGTNAPVPSATVNFTLGTQSCLATTNASGHASCSFVVTQHPGSYTASASFGGDPTYNAANGSSGFTIAQEETQVTYGGALTSDYHDPFTASATLADPIDGIPIAGKLITFTLGVGDTCSATTNAAGVASCSINPTQVPATYPLVTSFAGDVDYVASSDTESFVVTREQTTTTYTGPTVILQGASGVTLKARLLEDGTVAPVPFGQTITLSLGGQSCTGTTDASGNAQCTLTFTGALGPEPLAASFAGDAYYLPSSDTGKTATVFAFPSHGAFTLGNNTVAAATPTTTVTWWDDAWASFNSLSGGPAPTAFKGFAGTISTLPNTSPANVCGTTFKTTSGNSPPPASEVPSYMGVLVANSVTKSGTTINGRWGKIVVVRVDPGYSPSPGHPGTGKIVATFCS